MNKFISKYYNNASEGRELTKYCIDKLKNEHNFDTGRTILATSVCSDEVIRSATNFRDYMPRDEPFQLGGLAGYPFTGITGFKAFASHIPDNGFAIILYGPHIGISNSGTLGQVFRAGQQLESSCCGALMSVVSKQQQNEVTEIDREFDYQHWKIADNLDSDKQEIISHSEPLLSATDSMYHQIDTRIKVLLEKTSDQFAGTSVALIGGIIINTDFNHPDYFELREMSVHKF